MSERRYRDEVVLAEPLTKGLRYDVAALDKRIHRVSWLRGDESTDEIHGYDWGYYFADDGTYLGADQHGIEPEFWVSGDEPIALRSEVSIPTALLDAIEAKDLAAIDRIVGAAWLSMDRPTPTPEQESRLRAVRSIYRALGGNTPF